MNIPLLVICVYLIQNFGVETLQMTGGYRELEDSDHSPKQMYESGICMAVVLLKKHFFRTNELANQQSL